ncbi:D-sedoheptulose-7-phosphate isomerase [Pseudobacteriovorax antillogorgiicola]|uniref:Phosphoheptose isomerase n=1 Tax=Pseudobacteriovorax antillogorgiicola TaxID=1513793 RepID=A0A1Y6CN43_9BACT|nr:SIS domain-containing protein [Pseudobacteriovorax antillogorgiicola]TCS44425.1 phosphoheptose isomerase [Pseudobacteriovorax antillogorgiicola]SMF79014.1 phosphoheptose isomerase [Pseudobacteriovorax antillogorgiicola]
MLEHVKASLTEAKTALENLLENEAAMGKIVQAADLLSECFESRGHVYSCGNGGSMCDAMHFAEELSGRFRKDRPALGAIAMGDGAHITCTGNDFGFEEVFSRFIEAHGRSGDVLLGISTSGKSENVIRAVRRAKELGVKTICLTGKPNSALSELADVEICTPGGRFADRVQELHIKVIHTLIELVERKLFNETYEV